MHFTRYYFLILISFFCSDILSQQDIAIGEWKAYIPYNRNYGVTQSSSHVYYACDAGILKLDKEDLSAQFFSKVDGLSDTEPREIAYHEPTSSLVTAYTNGNIDIIAEDGVYNMPNVRFFEQVTDSKYPLNIRLDDKNHAFICFSFGISQIDLENRSFGFTLLTDFAINDIEQFNGYYYLATEDGIYKASDNSAINHADISVWTRLEDAAWPIDYSVKEIVKLNNSLFFEMNGALFELSDPATPLLSQLDENYKIRDISKGKDKLMISFKWAGGGYKPDRFYITNESANILHSYINHPCVAVVYQSIEDEQGRIFIADDANQVRYFEEVGSYCSTFNFNGPNRRDAFEVFVGNENVFIASGGTAENLGYTFSAEGVYVYNFNTDQWDQLNAFDTPQFSKDTVLDYKDVLVRDETDEIIIGTFYDGIIVVRDSVMSLLDDFNSCLEKSADENLRVRIGDMTLDDSGNLWVTNNRADIPLKMFDKEWNCYEFDPGGSNDVMAMVIDENGYKWIATFDRGNGLIVFDEGDLEDQTDDQTVILNTGNADLESNQILSLAIDLDGDVWVGTDQGVTVFECTASVFSSGCRGVRRKVNVGGNVAYLLENERIRTIAVDGANRKWFGTSNGVFVQSSAGDEEVLQFNTDNSPLLSNVIMDIEVNKETGEVFIATNRGLMSYRSDATHGSVLHKEESQVFAFPNPVRPEYDGPIAIKGLARDSRIRITDIAGRLVFQTEANGGQAIWDGKDYNGRKANSGVYLVFATSRESFNKPDALVAKILIVR
jgi:hypothetical protein